MGKAENFNESQKPRFRLGAVINRFLKPKYWVIKKCGFPYAEGYATYNWKKKMILDTGMSKEKAKAICRELNGL